MNKETITLSDRLLDFVVRVIKLAEALPKTPTSRHVGGEMVRACSSSGANYEEACGAESRSDFIHKMSIVLKELKETRFWLRVVHRAEMVESSRANPLTDECEQLCAIIARSILTAKRRR
jgi:four helix bundle protein